MSILSFLSASSSRLTSLILVLLSNILKLCAWLIFGKVRAKHREYHSKYAMMTRLIKSKDCVKFYVQTISKKALQTEINDLA